MLTAFVLESYTLLQADNGQDAVDLLARISIQMTALHVSSSSSNSAFIPQASQSFSASTSAIWINCLWFLSLILSLAAAFFGILAKQWLREYMKWNTSLGDPKENVLVRQIRFEAWKEWHLDTTLSFIPGMLEMAVVLFFIGLVILLWTIHYLVAIISSTAVGIFLIAVCAVMSLPAFFKRCPYK